MIKLHVGCGSHHIPGWVNSDLKAGNGVDKIIDARKPLPYKDNSVDLIFSEHFIEHITEDEGLGFLKECYRVLGRAIRLSTPDLTHVVNRYIANNTDVPEELSVYRAPTRCKMINNFMRRWGHQFCYDKEHLSMLLMRAGFSTVKICERHESDIVELRNLEIRPQFAEFYIEAYK